MIPDKSPELQKKIKLIQEDDDNLSDFSWEKEDQNKIDKKQIRSRKDCPYLGTIKRHCLDFDFEKLCSVTLSNLNVYACLVCGKYFSGRGKNTHAYFHSLQEKHHLYINLHNEKVYCLPDSYEVQDPSLEDIQFNLRPWYTNENLDQNKQYSRAIDGTDYLSGFIGLNNIKNTDYVNVVIQALSRIPDLRDFFLKFQTNKYASDVQDHNQLIIKRFAELIRKIWNPKNFRNQVSPHELMQAISLKSKKKYQIGKQSDPLNLLAWVLNMMSQEIQLTKNTNIINQCFQGELQVFFYKATDGRIENKPDIQFKKFMFLTLDIPPCPLYKDEQKQSIIPHQPIFTLLKKFDGYTASDHPEGKYFYKIKTLSKYLILHFKRFVKNNFYTEKNSTIVSFPLLNLDLKEHLKLETNQESKYNLLASICHEGKPDSGFYRIYVKNKALNEWFQIQDLLITPVMPQLVSLSEAYIQIYERQD